MDARWEGRDDRCVYVEGLMHSGAKQIQLCLYHLRSVAPEFMTKLSLASLGTRQGRHENYRPGKAENKIASDRPGAKREHKTELKKTPVVRRWNVRAQSASKNTAVPLPLAP